MVNGVRRGLFSMFVLHLRERGCLEWSITSRGGECSAAIVKIDKRRNNRPKLPTKMLTGLLAAKYVLYKPHASCRLTSTGKFRTE